MMDMDTCEAIPRRMSSEKSSELPAWRMPISTSFSSSIRDRNSPEKNSSLEQEMRPVDLHLGSGSSSEEIETSRDERPAVSKVKEEVESQTVIQILLPCIICNRTFSPEALERHSNVCTKVNIKSPYKPERGKFDISEKRKKDTRLEYFIPPPAVDALTDNRFGIQRGGRNRASLRGTSCTTKSSLESPLRRERSVSQTRESRAPSTTRAVPPPTTPTTPNDYPYDDTSEFGSNNSEENNSPTIRPSYAKPIAPTGICSYCNRSFGIKSFDRHVEFCKEIYERKQYEIQPAPKEKEDAMERQELRTKYRPMKSSSSCSSLRSMSPAKDFANMAMKLFGGLRRTEGTTNLYFNQIKNNLKKSNESIAASCYGDYTRGIRRASPSPIRTPQQMATNKLNNLLTKSYLHQQQQQHHLHQQQYGLPHLHPNPGGSLLPMRINTSSNIPKMTKSTDSLSLMAGNNFSHVQSSGYGQSPTIMMMNSNNNPNFSRNSRSRSSLHKNFFRTKRAEPEGTENTSLSQSPTGTSPLIITPVNFYSKGNKSGILELEGNNSEKKSEGERMERMMGVSRQTSLTSDPDYDPYEKAAKQLEELLKTSPIKSSKRTSRRTGLEKAFESVGVMSDMTTLGKAKLGRTQSLDYNSDPFGIGGGMGVGKGRGRIDQFGMGGMSLTPNIDDSYWDTILRKGDNHQGSGGGNNNNNNNRSGANPEIGLQEESDTSGASDTAKSRAMSNTSSADSAFSRSEVNDPEFEALESIASLGDVTGSSNRYKKSNYLDDRKKSEGLFSTTKSLESHRSVPRSASVDQGRVPMDISPAPDANLREKSIESNSSSGGGWAKFCHECGTPYPTSLAKFCPECGEKRMYKT